MADLSAVLDAFDEAVAAAAPVVEGEVVEDTAEVAHRARRRVGFLGRSVVVALVGGTGSGKSSLLNALAGDEVATTGVLRPTTQAALAWLPREPEPGLSRLLDALGVTERKGHDLPTPVCVLDMPDVDSVAGAHRDEVQRLLPQVDAVIWVLDPEKYNDRVVHEDFLQHLVSYESQFLFVLNQIDRVFESDRYIIEDDLRRQLVADGFADPSVVITAAAPDVGPPLGIDALWARLEAIVEDKDLIADKLLADIAGAVRSLETAAGFDRDVDWRTLWSEARDRSATMLGQAAVSPDSVRSIVATGRSHALARHPFGLMGGLRRRRVGRALAIDRDPTVKLRQWHASPAAGAARRSLAELLGSVIARLRGPTGRSLAERFDDRWIDDQVEAAMERTLRHVDHEPPEPSAAGLLGWMGLFVSIIGAGWWWAFPPERGDVPWHLILVASGALLLVASRWFVRWWADRRSERSVVALRAGLSEAVAEHLDSLIGRPVGAELRARAELRAALATVSVATAAQKENP